ncbi:MAG: metallophosphoesterase [candidate division WOR-3 bacterium]|jgi:putative phosphoesterase|nr:metallophosphoesterase [candidate division WOR-3 bacterium]MCR4423262.1 metallophosphoesterase [candidate division WOR-3 bacterium]MDH7518601.1 metallophosphoesterase [bacterium]
MSLIGLISDTHDNLDRVRLAVKLFNELKVERVLHCGDLVAPFVLKEFKPLTVPFFIVLGNCDGDRISIKDVAAQLGFTVFDGRGELTVAGKTVCFTHQPADPIPQCDFYIHGHTHQVRYESGCPIVVNPGEAGGWLTARSTVATLDTETGRVDFFEL